jgi:hypothetical protein
VTIHLDNKMMKGANLVLNEKVLQFIQEALTDISGDGNEAPAYSDDLADENPTLVLKNLEDKGWERTMDRFGDKAVKSMPYPASTPALPTDELRITAVIDHRTKVLKLDIRPWGQWSEWTKKS